MIPAFLDAETPEACPDNVSLELLQMQRKKLIRKISKLQRALRNVEIQLSTRDPKEMWR